MEKQELEQMLEDVVTESTPLAKKDKDRLVENLLDFMVTELGFEFSDDEGDDEEE